jgi:hypothetical protein
MEDRAMTCECCGQERKFLFPVLSRDNGFIDDLDRVCSDCAELVNDEYYCGAFRNLVPFECLVVGYVDALLVA